MSITLSNFGIEFYPINKELNLEMYSKF